MRLRLVNLIASRLCRTAIQTPKAKRKATYICTVPLTERYVVLRGVDFRKFLYQDVILHDCDATPLCDTERTPGVQNPWKNAEACPAAKANLPFNADAFQCIRNVHGYFAEFNRITKRIPELNALAAEQKRSFHLTNNCREPGKLQVCLD